ncbi:acyl-CoA thioesterase [Sulfitobacter sabulilitoris]|uniref:Acyl-CoA thioesterase n=1 Tax=Sulfitobacter sabulilitoris TaxID=2562655 RepID=A0A5S3Q6K7_9RHOB|nr:acyl-CoA thioesterase [Sulfitobacter sabulilitoris]TMM52473.1 acyl-CoA thioesterase [Sulfitobacter sabulilitoris]
MFPFVRLFKDIAIASRQPRLAQVTDLHVSRHICWPWDLDIWRELNNGRALTLYDLGRIAAAQRAGLIAALRREGWGLTMAGSSVRYRRRIRGFERFEMRSRLVCWDDKFTYIEQSMWKRDGECASHVLYRAAVTGADGIVPPQTVLRAMGRDPVSPDMPDWIANWIAAEATRPWPPMQDAPHRENARQGIDAAAVEKHAA